MYVHNDPVNLIDPFGLHSLGPIEGTPCVTSCHPSEQSQEPTSTCKARQTCLEQANTFKYMCMAGSWGGQATCIAACISGTEGIGTMGCIKLCNWAFKYPTAGCYSLYLAMRVKCNNIPCVDDCEEE